MIYLLQVLDFPRNPIEVLENDIFMKRNLLNLQAITLTSCEINAIQLHAFRYVNFYTMKKTTRGYNINLTL